MSKPKVFPILVFCLLLGSGLISNSIIPASNSNNLQLIAVSNNIFQTLRSLSKVTHVTIINDSEKDSHQLDSLISEFAAEQVPMIITNNENILENTTAVVGSIVLKNIQNCEHLKKLLVKLNDTIGNRNVKYIVIVHDYCYGDLKNIPQDFRAYEVLFLVHSKDNELVKFTTFIPNLDPQTCSLQGYVTQNLESNLSEVKELEQLFNNEIVDLKGCSLKVGVIPSKAYIDVKKPRQSMKYLDEIIVDDLNGTVLDIVTLIGMHLNATLKFYYVNFSMNAAQRAITVNRHVDVCIGSILPLENSFDYCQYSTAYINENIYWVYYAEKMHRSWKTLINKTIEARFFIVFYVFYCVAWYLLCYFDNRAVSFQLSLLYSWGAYVGGRSVLRALSGRQKFLNICFWIMCIHRFAFDNSNIYSFLVMTRPPLEIFRSAKELMTADRPLYLNERYIDVTAIHPKHFENLYMEKCSSYDDCLQKSIDNKGATIVMSYLFFKFQKETSLNDGTKLLPIRDPFFNFYFYMVTGKHSPVSKRIHQSLSRLYESGITNQLIKQSHGRGVLVDQSKLITKNTMHTTFSSCVAGCPIKLRDIMFAFYIWMGCCAFAGFVFIIELLKSPNS